ncbi:C6 zinc finger domain protein [Colletotrichum higginsianum IMI 349063]|uniref:C6 zinc finger domain protein n=3 Tax=Colletotrichum higginsianum TaxID=80884 RepID=A0A1B7YFW6_COLHI|nr:C6 zinc finger domain protein [Colletotrichum higginsianum IMI 349063]OBR10774.1 C6 zinc finger domain protein [Colletotrichum higginsianum IMI 349063]
MESQPSRSRPKKTDICDETRPECVACVQRGIQCSGYQRPVTFKDVTSRAAESSKRFEEARWKALRLEDDRRKRRRIEPLEEPLSASQSPSGNVTALPQSTPPSMETLPAPLPPWSHTNTDGWLGGSFTLPWSLFETSSGLVSNALLQEDQSHERAVTSEEDSPSEDNMTTAPAKPLNSLVAVSRGEQPDPLLPTEAPSPALALMSWDEFIVPDGSSPGSTRSTTSPSSPLGDPTTDSRLSLPLEEVLIQHFDRNVVPSIPVTLAFPNLFRQSNCFRFAVLALAASNMKLLQPLPLNAKRLREAFDDKSVWLYYDTAVKGLQAQLHNIDNHHGEELAGAALLLAYHELEAGTALGIRNHATGLDAIASKLDFAASSVPDLFKAWRMLRYDVRFMMTPTRRTCNAADVFDVASLLDPQLAIRDILSRLFSLHARFAMEASFTQDNTVEGGSASEKAAIWLMSVLGRACDHRNFRLRDFHKDDLTPDFILRQCDIFAHRLDNWYKALCDHDMPTVRLGSDSDIVSGPTFETFVTYKFADERKAQEYVIYLVCRMTCSYLRSVFNPSVKSSATDALGKVILGIVCGMNMQQRQQFTVLRLDLLLKMAASLSEGTNFITTILDSILPRVMSFGFTGPDMIAWTYLRSSLEFELRERRKGRAIRMTIDGWEEDCEMWELVNSHAVAAFGDYNGKGYFRDCYVIKGLG